MANTRGRNEFSGSFASLLRLVDDPYVDKQTKTKKMETRF